MTALYDSPFLIALGWTIASSLWQAALLWLIYQVINSGESRVSPALKHTVAASFLFIAFAWFGITFVQNYNEVAALKQSLENVVNSNITLAQALFSISTAEVSAGSRIATVFNNFLPYLSAAYLMILLILLIKLTKAYIFSVQLKTQGLIELDNQWLQFVDKYALSIGIKRKIKVFLSEKIDVPATMDFLKPIILLPVATFNHLTIPQVESVLLHELAHIRRNDYLVNIAASVIETVLFFNPFVHLLALSLKKEREHCCDDLVLRHTFDPHSYASALLSLEKMRIGIQPLAVAATGESGQLLGRVKRIMNVKNTNFNYGQKLIALVVTAFILLSLAWLSPSSDQNINSVPASVQHTVNGALKTTNDQTTVSTESFARTQSIPSPKTESITTIKDKEHRTTNIITIDSILAPIPAAPPIPPTISFKARVQGADNAGKNMVFDLEDPAIFPGKYPEEDRLAQAKDIELSFNNAEWEKAQSDMEHSYAISLDALNQDLQLSINGASKSLAEIFRYDQKRQVAEKYLRQILQKNLKQKENQTLQYRILAEQERLSIDQIRKVQSRTDSIMVKPIKRKAIQKTIWI
ncbi:MAG: M56 family metallopeptidase [Chitinophagaceae bacterium]|nr:M56 family metallopeptidase [Chitinophagaceae bacterium]